MTLLDIIFLSFILLGLIYGAIRGTRPALWLTVVLLASLLAGMTLIGPLENVVLNLSGIPADDYPGAPGVAVLILRERTALAYITALIPGFITLFLVFALALGRVLLRGFFVEPSRTALVRISGGLLGLINGALVSLIVGVQLTRLPWPPAVVVSRGSLLMSAVNHIAEFLIPSLAGAA